MAIQMTLGDLRKIIEQIGTGHDAKPITIATGRAIFKVDANDVAVQGDRILFWGYRP